MADFDQKQDRSLLLEGIFQLTSCHGTQLILSEKNILYHKKKDLINSQESTVLLLTLAGSSLGFIVSKEYLSGTIRSSRVDWDLPLILVNLKESENSPYKFSICILSVNRLLTASKVYDENSLGLISISQCKIKDYEIFDLNPTSIAIPKDVSVCLEWFSKVDLDKLSANSMRLLIDNKSFTRIQKKAAFSLSMLLCSNSTIENLVNDILLDEVYFKKLLSIYSDDIWLVVGVQNLLNKLNLKEANNFKIPVFSTLYRKFTNDNKMILMPDIDYIANAGSNFKSMTPGHLLNSFFRKKIEPNKNVCIVATARNEGIYLVEWVAYYLALGVEHIFLYSNDNNDGSDMLLDALSKHGFITWIDNNLSENANAQGKAYSHAFSLSTEILEYKWALVIDIDEYFSFNTDIYSSIHDFLNAHDKNICHSIAVNWVYVGSSGKVNWENIPLIQRLTFQVGEVNAHIKSFVKPNQIINSGPHFPKSDERSTLVVNNANGKTHTYGKAGFRKSIENALSDDPDDSHARIYHFFHRTAEEFLWKWSRNRGDYPKSEEDIYLALDKRFLNGFLKQFNIKNKDISDKLIECVPEYDDAQEKLLQFQNIRSAQKHVIGCFKERSARVIELYIKKLACDFGKDGQSMIKVLEDSRKINIEKM